MQTRRAFLGHAAASAFGAVGSQVSDLFVPPALAQTRERISLSLCCDVSDSITATDYSLQKMGTAAGLKRARELIPSLGEVHVNYIEYAMESLVIIPWTILQTPQEVDRFAEQLESSQRNKTIGIATNVPAGMREAIDASYKLATDKGLLFDRQIIDISGDGYGSNQGSSCQYQRGIAESRGYNINCLAMPDVEGTYTLQQIQDFFQSNVICGEGAFVLPVRQIEDYEESFYLKLMTELLSNLDHPAQDLLIQPG